MKWFEQPLIAIDLETTGVDPQTARVWEFGAVCQNDPGDGEQHQILINPDTDIPSEVVKLCNLTVDDLDHINWDAPTFAQVAPKICNIMARRIEVGYNILSYDWPLLDAEFHRLTPAQTINPNRYIIDVFVLVRALAPRLRSHKLADVAAHYGVRLDGSAHRAVADCLMTLGILDVIRPELPEDLGELLEMQGEAKVKQDLDFEKYGYWLASDRTENDRLFIACGKPTGPTTRPDTGLSIERTDLQSRSA